MKNLFPGHYRPSTSDFESLWRDAIFIFDTNVLLNLYSYPDAAREIFLSVLNRVTARSWIPYQVALEFHRNRFSRIKSANEPLIKLRAKVREASKELEAGFAAIEFEQRNTGIDDLHDRLNATRDANAKLVEAIDLACARLPNVAIDDPIGSRVAELFCDHVGSPPANQSQLDELIKDGPRRYDKRIPPGFKDAKEKKDLEYADRGIIYPAMFGDLILWYQSIEYVRSKEIKSVIFVTGDGKDDWWYSLDGKVLGPSPDLIKEFLDKTSAERFWIYRADQFLKNAEVYIKLMRLQMRLWLKSKRLRISSSRRHYLSVFLRMMREVMFMLIPFVEISVQIVPRISSKTSISPLSQVQKCVAS